MNFWPFKRKQAQPVVALEAKPLHLNPTNRAQHERHLGRIGRLRQAIKESPAGAYRDGLQAELDRRRAALKASGLGE
jgi:hypothetical protein